MQVRLKADVVALVYVPFVFHCSRRMHVRCLDACCAWITFLLLCTMYACFCCLVLHGLSSNVYMYASTFLARVVSVWRKFDEAHVFDLWVPICVLFTLYTSSWHVLSYSRMLDVAGVFNVCVTVCIPFGQVDNQVSSICYRW